MADTKLPPEDVFVCGKCTEKCDTCEPLDITNESMADYDLVYYAPPVVDERNWGAFFDFDVNKVNFNPLFFSNIYRIDKMVFYVDL